MPRGEEHDPQDDKRAAMFRDWVLRNTHPDLREEMRKTLDSFDSTGTVIFPTYEKKDYWLPVGNNKTQECDPKDMNMDELLSRARAYAKEWAEAQSYEGYTRYVGRDNTSQDTRIMHQLGILWP